MKTAPELEQQAAVHVAALMAAAARTSPKTRGIDNIRVLAIDDDEPTKQQVIAKMKEIARAENRPSLERDANNIAAAPALLVIGVESNPAGLNCGFCGQATCEALEAAKGVCAFNSIDLGIATCSAAAMAGQFHVDNRVMYSIGRACLDLRLFGDKVKQALGIPLSVTGKNPFFDRKA
ncbi:MAG: DUF2148 domain-containing protein [Verrucomicrobia bacterium]|jgi:uncharacterized ferredoxin-like protein|nr:DUF2148 domain-containing protein [Verrucomicrobiota bacterium]